MELNSRVEELEGVISELLSEKTRLEDRTSFLEKALECRSSSSEAGGVTALRSASLVGNPYSAATPSSLCRPHSLFSAVYASQAQTALKWPVHELVLCRMLYLDVCTVRSTCQSVVQCILLIAWLFLCSAQLHVCFLQPTAERRGPALL